MSFGKGVTVFAHIGNCVKSAIFIVRQPCMLKIWLTGLQPWSRPSPECRRSGSVFKPRVCWQLSGY
jgi:hypothetical protein